MTQKDALKRVALTLPSKLLERVDVQLASDRQKERKLDRSALIRRAVQFYLDNRVAVRAERIAFAEGVEARLTTLLREYILVSLALFHLQVHQQETPPEMVNEAFRWAAKNVDTVQKLIPPAKPK